MRLFFGLIPGPQTALDIVSWRENSLPPMLHPVPINNLHVTLSFLGQVENRQLEQLIESAGQVRVSGFEMNINQLGFLSKPKVLWIGPEKAPAEIFQLSRMLTSVRRRMGLHAEGREYLPHMSIARRCETPPPASVMQPEFRIFFDSFDLIESVNTRSGVQYRSMEQWSLA